MTACISSVYQTQCLFASGKRAIKQDHTREHPLLLATVVIFEACESVFLSTSIGIVLVSGSEDKRGESRNKHLCWTTITRTPTQQGVLHQDYQQGNYIGCLWSNWLSDGELVVRRRKRRRPPVFFFVSIGEANSRLVKYFSKLLPLSLLDPRVFGQGTDSRGTESRGIDSKNFGHETDSRGTESNNFLVAQDYYLLRGL